MTSVFERTCAFCGRKFEFDEWAKRPGECSCGAICVNGSWYKNSKHWWDVQEEAKI